MFRAAQTMDSLSGACVSGWESTLDRILIETEAAELELSVSGQGTAQEARKASGSFYTPADVADHVWDRFFRLHDLHDASALRVWIARFRLVEPSAGSGIFLFTFLRRALRMGLSPVELQAIRFSIIDVNYAALRFVGLKIGEIEASLDIVLDGVSLVQRDFLEWAENNAFDRVAFVGNPPFVANPKGHKWRNLFADFVTAMLDYSCREKAIGLILPMSVCFSRDYERLRARLFSSGLGVSASSYDNIPDCLFKAGKPDSRNSNKANSQRCTILMLGGPNKNLRESSPMLRWGAAERGEVLATAPKCLDFSGYCFDGQIPRPVTSQVLAHLSTNDAIYSIGEWLRNDVQGSFAVAAVARNFIGIRDVRAGDPSAVVIATGCPERDMVLLQILGSPAFYQYWLSLGDGFHVTRGLIGKFPVSAELHHLCFGRASTARRIWENRAIHVREKLNAGKVVRSYDFRDAFSYVHFRHDAGTVHSGFLTVPAPRRLTSRSPPSGSIGAEEVRASG